MSKKKIYKKHLEKGKFYTHSDLYGGHPALLYKKYDRKNEYYLIIFTSSFGPRRIRLKHSIQPSKVKISYVHKNPTVAKRRQIGSKELKGMKVHKDDKATIEVIKRKR